jgi:hypothetical protein
VILAESLGNQRYDAFQLIKRSPAALVSGVSAAYARELAGRLSAVKADVVVDPGPPPNDQRALELLINSVVTEP